MGQFLSKLPQYTLTKNDYDDDGDDLQRGEKSHKENREGLDRETWGNRRQWCYNCKKNIFFVLFCCLRSQEGLHSGKGSRVIQETNY